MYIVDYLSFIPPKREYNKREIEKVLERCMEITRKHMKIKVLHIRDHYDIYIGRGSEWGNPFYIGRDGTREEVIEKYRIYLLNNNYLRNKLHELKGKILGCHCKPLTCHGDVLVDMVNKL